MKSLIYRVNLKSQLKFNIMELGLKDKHVLITGGAGGIGEAIVNLLYKEGANVSLHFNTSKEKASEIQQRTNPEKVKLVQGDLRNESDVKQIFSTAINNFGRIDCLIANAAIAAPERTLTSDITLERWNNTIQTNLTGVFLCVRAFFNNLKQFPNKFGSVVLIGSTAGEFGEAGHSDYSATKAAMMYGLTKTWKNEIIKFAPLGRVNTVAPGWVYTQMAADTLDDTDTLKRILQTIPMSKIAVSDDIAHAVVFVLSDIASGHISGQTLVIHGGMEGRVLHEKDEVDLSFTEKLKK